MAGRKLNSVASGQSSITEVELLDAFCARPKCRKKIRRAPGRGRPKTYCSDDCRLAARDEQRTLRSRLSHYEDVIAQIRIDLTAYGSSGEGQAPPRSPDALMRRALDALLIAEGALRYAPQDDPVTHDLRALVEAVSPALRVPAREPVDEAS